MLKELIQSQTIIAPKPRPRRRALVCAVLLCAACALVWRCVDLQLNHGEFLKREGRELVGAFKTPSLRNVAMTAPYMQAGQLQTLEQVVAHYNRPFPPFYDRAQHPSRPHFDILPLNLDQTQQAQLVAFLKTLTSPIPNSPWWRPPPS